MTALVKDNDVAYVAAGRIRRHKNQPGTATLPGVADTYEYDPLDHAQRPKTELHRPIQPGNTLRGCLQDLNRIHRVGGSRSANDRQGAHCLSGKWIARTKGPGFSSPTTGCIGREAPMLALLGATT